MDRGAWRAAVHGVARSRTELKQLSTHVLLTLIETAARVSREVIPPAGNLNEKMSW